MARMTHDKFIEELKNTQPNLRVLGKYTRIKGEIHVSDHNDIEYISTPRALLKGVVPTIRLAINKTLCFSSFIFYVFNYLHTV
jgi:hypothetical protein